MDPAAPASDADIRYPAQSSDPLTPLKPRSKTGTFAPRSDGANPALVIIDIGERIKECVRGLLLS